MSPRDSGRAATVGKPSTPGRVPCPTCGCAGEDHARLRGELRPHGTHAAYNRHIINGEPPCDLCWDGERAYQRAAKRRHRAAAKARDRALVDEIAVERACRGERVRLTRRERVEAVRRLAAQGATPGVIAERLRMNGVRVHQVLEGAA